MPVILSFEILLPYERAYNAAQRFIVDDRVEVRQTDRADAVRWPSYENGTAALTFASEISGIHFRDAGARALYVACSVSGHGRLYENGRAESCSRVDSGDLGQRRARRSRIDYARKANKYVS